MKITIDTDNCIVCQALIKELIEAEDDEDKYWKAEEITDHWNQHSSIMHQIVASVMENHNWSQPIKCKTNGCPNEKISHSQYCMPCINTGTSG